MHIVFTSWQEKIQVHDRLGTQRLNIVNHACWNNQETSWAYLMPNIAHMINGAPAHNVRHLFKRMTVRIQLHAGMAFVHHHHHIFPLESLAADSSAHHFRRDVLPVVSLAARFLLCGLGDTHLVMLLSWPAGGARQLLPGPAALLRSS